MADKEDSYPDYTVHIMILKNDEVVFGEVILPAPKKEVKTDSRWVQILSQKLEELNLIAGDVVKVEGAVIFKDTRFLFEGGNFAKILPGELNLKRLAKKFAHSVNARFIATVTGKPHLIDTLANALEDIDKAH